MAGVLKHLPAICAVTAPSPGLLLPAAAEPLGADLGLHRRSATARRASGSARCSTCPAPTRRASSMSSIARPTRRRAPISRSARWCMPASMVFAASSRLPEPRNVAAMSEAERKRRRHPATCRNRSARRSTTGGDAGSQGLVRPDLSRRLSPPQARGDRHAHRPRRGRAVPALRRNLLTGVLWMKRLLLAIFCLLPLAARGASPEEDYFASRDQYIANFKSIEDGPPTTLQMHAMTQRSPTSGSSSARSSGRLRCKASPPRERSTLTRSSRATRVLGSSTASLIRRRTRRRPWW